MSFTPMERTSLTDGAKRRIEVVWISLSKQIKCANYVEFEVTSLWNLK